MPCLRRRFPTHCARAPMHARRGLRAAAASCPIPRAAAAALHTRAAPRERVCLGRSWLRPRKPSPRKRSAARATHAPRFLLRLFRGTPRSARAHLDPRRAGAASAGFGRGAFLLPPARGGANRLRGNRKPSGVAGTDAVRTGRSGREDAGATARMGLRALDRGSARSATWGRT